MFPPGLREPPVPIVPGAGAVVRSSVGRIPHQRLSVEVAGGILPALRASPSFLGQSGEIVSPTTHGFASDLPSWAATYSDSFFPSAEKRVALVSSVTTTDPSGNHGLPASIGFRIVKK